VYEWDPAKARSNQEEHGVDLADAEGVLEDVRAITIEDNDAEGEQRFVTLGMDFLGRLLVVVFTYRGDAIRIISARKATRTEVKEYAKGI
jgi:uncharacterized DUF497 family protein